MRLGGQTSWHLAGEWLRARWPFLAGWVLLGLSIGDVVLRRRLDVLNLVGLAASALLLLVDHLAYRKRLGKLFLEPRSWPYGKAKPPAGDAHGRVVELGGEHLLVDPELDMLLDQSVLPLRVMPGRFTVDKQLRSYRYCALRHRRGMVRTNGTCTARHRCDP
jgi:hypothetical protein